MAQHFAPGLYLEPPVTRPKAVPVRMDVAGFVGIAERGPVSELVALDGWPGFVAKFGSFIPNGLLAYAVRGFFENGGRRCVVVRVAAPEFKTKTLGVQPADRLSSTVQDVGPIKSGSLISLSQSVATITAGPQPPDKFSSVVANARGFGPGGIVVLRQANKPIEYARPVHIDTTTNEIRWREPLAVVDITQPFQLELERRDQRVVGSIVGSDIKWTRALAPGFDISLPIFFAAGAAPADGLIYDEEGRPVLRISAANPGQWGAQLSVKLRCSVASETRSKVQNAPDPSTRLTVEQNAALAPGATVQVMQDGVASVRRLIASIDRKDGRLFFDQALPGTFDMVGAANGSKPIRVRRLALALSVNRNGRLIELFSNLDLPSTAEPERSPVNDRSEWIHVERLASPTVRPWPDPMCPLLRRGACVLEGGRDGIAMIDATDFTGDLTSPRRWGLRLFELDNEPAALAAPDAVIEPSPAISHAPLPEESPDPCAPCPPPPPPAPSPSPPAVESSPTFGPAEVFAIQIAMVEHCEQRGDRIAVIDPPLSRVDPDPYDLEALLAWRRRFDSSYAALYFPWLLLTDPLNAATGPLKAVPPSGAALGLFAATDADPGTQSAPANVALAWVAALPRAINSAEHEGLNPAGINCIRSFSGRGIRPFGARTLSSNADWALLNVRRLIIRLKRTLARSLQWAVFEPNNRDLTDMVFAVVEGLLETEWNERRLAGNSPEEAFYIRKIQSADIYDNGQFVLEIGVAPVTPAEFVVLRLSRTEDRLEIAELTDPSRAVS